MHWLDVLLPQIEEFLRGREAIHCSAGLSISGLQHVGRLRGEVVLTNSISRELRTRGMEVTQYLVLYTQDPWKGTEGQLSRFSGDEGSRYIDWRLKDVPDPFECHASWVDHYWEDFGNHMDRFAPGVELRKTGDIYGEEEMRRIVLDLVGRSERVRSIINKYRGTRKYSEGWIPFDAFCTECNTIGAAETSEITPEGSIHYSCKCGHEGISRMEDGKLNWRLEWPALWKLLQVDIEAFGKDHATPGGSRDSCKEIARELLDILPPFGIPYEWVGVRSEGKDLGDMSSSGFIGFTPKDWLKIGEPEVMRYIYMFSPIAKRIVFDLARVDVYHDQYDEAERLFFQDGDDERARAYELTQIPKPPSALPFRLPYRHASLLSQVGPSEELTEWAVKRLRDTGILAKEPSDSELDGLARRLLLSQNWAQNYAPDDLKVVILDDASPILNQLMQKEREALRRFGETLSDIKWTEEHLKKTMTELTGSGDLPVTTKQFFRSLYMLFLGRARGPRAAPFLAVLGRELVLKRLQEASVQAVNNK